MAGEKSSKRNFIEISSSEESESSPTGSDEESVEEISSSTSCYEDDDNDENEWNYSENGEDDEAQVDEYEDCADASVDKDDAEAMSNKVTQLIRGGNDLQELKLVECKAYLRRHGLRLLGTKGECIERIKEHWRLKDGNGEAFYPRSSFTIDCTGDVCTGDVVLFKQKVYQNWNSSDKITRSRSWRTVAGRIVKESYGATRQQHTFTVRPILNGRWELEEFYAKEVEVLWSRGSKKLNPLFPLLVKGRNLYKLKTFRQRWKNEKERLQVLAEKHERGAAERTIRAMRKAKVISRTDKSSRYNGDKRRKHFHHSDPSRTRESTRAKKNCQNKHGKAAKNKKRSPCQSSTTTETFRSKQNVGPRGPASHWRYQNFQSVHVREPTPLPHNHPSQPFYHFRPDVFPSELHQFPQHRGSSSNARLPYSHPPQGLDCVPVSEWETFSHGRFMDPAYSHPMELHEPRNYNRFPRLMDNVPSFYSPATDTRRWS